MRCPDCNKFVPLAPADPELDLEVECLFTPADNPGDSVTGTVRCVLTCEECGSEMAEYTADVEEERLLDHKEAAEHDLTITSESASPTDRMQMTGRKGKPVKHGTQFLGAEVALTLTCSCGASAYCTFTVEEEAI